MTAKLPARAIWTEEKIRELGVRIDGVTAVEIVTGYRATRARELLRRPEDLPFSVLRVGRRYVVPAAEVLAALGLSSGASNP